jgi:microcystin-dependent protein
MRSLIPAPSPAAFAQHEGTAFCLPTANDAALTLADVESATAADATRERFSLFFRGPRDVAVEAGTHRFGHDVMGDFDAYITPIHALQSPADNLYYQATFDRERTDAGTAPAEDDRREQSSSRRGFVGRLVAAVGSVGLLGLLSGNASDAHARSRPSQGQAGSGRAGLEPFIGQIILFGGSFAPLGYAQCDGQLIPISQNTALFALIGTIYGGDGQTTFALPDLRGRSPIHVGQGPGLSSYALGQQGGRETETLSANQIPAHSHSGQLPVSTEEADATSPNGTVLGAQPNARGTVPNYSTGAADGNMNVSIASTGGNQAHNNVSPYQVVNYLIALEGDFPPRN